MNETDAIASSRNAVAKFAFGMWSEKNAATTPKISVARTSP